MFTVGEGLLSNAEFLEKVSELLDESWLVTNNKKISYYNVPAGFDIEVTSFYEGQKESENKRAVMYIWQFGIFNYVTTGRTWAEFTNLIRVLKKILGLSDECRLVVYVHNLPYEFQFIRKRFEWEEVFLLSDRKPVYANAHGVEFRCSLKLAGGKSLENVGKDLQKYKVKKAVGNLDYNVMRSPLTPLTEKELEYCENDIRVIQSYIQEKIEQDGDITQIPLTNTGYVRQYCRKECFRRWKSYHQLMEELKVSPEEYSQLKRGFQGGFTHANAHYVNKVLHNVGSHDFTSSYPGVMVLEKFPMSRPYYVNEQLTREQLTELLLTKCCLFELELWDVVAKLHQDHPISRSKCYICEGEVTDNGRIVAADHLKLTVTEQDYFIYSEFYDWDERIGVSSFRFYEKNYLPKPFAMSILALYEKKTVLKGNKEEEVNYMISKNMLNSAYGMSVTDPVRTQIQYKNDVYTPIPPNIAESIEKYNSNVRRFLYYPWGVWVTAYARANLFSGILALGDDYVYSDTDSVKSLNTESHRSYFEAYNTEIMEKIEESASYYKIPIERYTPFGKAIGVWDYEGEYETFKTLGAKRYLTMKGGKYTLTLAGANKKKSMSYLENTGNPFRNFKHELTIPAKHSGRLILTYIDDKIEGDMIDFLGVPYHYCELSSVHMEPSDYNLTQSEDFIKYLKGISDFGE